jgi:hypothetical protein
LYARCHFVKSIWYAQINSQQWTSVRYCPFACWFAAWFEEKGPYKANPKAACAGVFFPFLKENPQKKHLCKSNQSTNLSKQNHPLSLRHSTF